MRAKFTPGPWIHDGDEVHGADGSMIASNISSGKGFDVKMANARLMASAPQLLESLEMISGMLKSGELVRDTHRDGRANFSEVMMSYVSTLNKIMAAIYAAKGEP